MKRSFHPIVPFLLSSLLLFGAPVAGLLSQTAAAQSSAVMQMARGELEKRGLTESEVRTRLLEKGIDVDNIPPADYPAYQSRVTTVLNELEAEKKGKGSQAAAQPVIVNVAAPATTPVAGSTSTGSTTTTQVGVTTPADLPETTPEEAAAEASQRVAQAAAANRGGGRIYGHSLFTDKTLDIFRTTDGAQAPDTYVLGEGDEIHITIFGASQTDIQQRIAPDGSIQPAGVSRIFLKGLTLAQARRVIQNQLSSAYLFRPDQLAVTIVTARTILVNIFGEAAVTGGFNISALNSAFNALSAAGGPTAIGSVRRIQHIRGTTKRTMDLYAFMSDPTVQYNFDLQNNDILHVPVADKLVSIQGAVKRPMTYEMLDKETLADLIRYAGGLTQDVYPDFIQIQRYVNGEEKLLEWNLTDVLNGREKVALVNGDVVRLKTINRPMDTYVDIDGSVYYPGRFDVGTNPTLKALIAQAQPNERAKPDFLLVERTRPDATIEVITVPFPGYNGAPDFTLQGKDKVHILDLASYRDVASISVVGTVRNPFERSFAYGDRLTVAQAIELAGGLLPTAYNEAYIFRRNLLNPDEITYLRIELDKAGDQLLQPGDQLNIYDNRTYTSVGQLRIFGAVRNPRTFTYDATMSLKDLINNAGGFTVGAAYNRVEIFRVVLSVDKPAKLDLITLQLDSSYNLVKPTHFALQPYDQIVVRMTPEFTLGRTVEINGQVQYPGTYVLENKQTKLSDIIKMAGGLLPDADPYGTRLFRTYRNRGEVTLQTKSAMLHRGLSHNPIIFEGDVININRLENVVTILNNGTRMAQYSIHAEGVDHRNVVYQGPKSAAWYIRNFAGGFDELADRNSVTVTLPNNQTVATKRFLGIFRDYPTVRPGATIALQLSPEKIEAEAKPKEKVDWEGITARGLSTLMSTLSIIMLVEQLAK